MSLKASMIKIPVSLHLVSNKNIVPAPAHAAFEFSVSKEDYRQFVYQIQENSKGALVVDLLRSEKLHRVIIYVKTTSAADGLAEMLNRSGITAESIHDNKSSRTRVRSISNFRSDATDVLVTTESVHFAFNTIEVAAIINYDLPVSAETYVERLTRHPGHMGVTAKVLSFCDRSEEGRLTNINRVLHDDLQVIAHNLNETALDIANKPS